MLLCSVQTGETRHLKPAWGRKYTRHWLLHNIVHSLPVQKTAEIGAPNKPGTHRQIWSRQRSGGIKAVKENQCTF